ncbi:MAG: hypothetical protein JWR87_2896 [Segetibacter sp.]|nr:hypothetical protein [Segetibacter sp.]
MLIILEMWEGFCYSLKSRILDLQVQVSDTTMSNIVFGLVPQNLYKQRLGPATKTSDASPLTRRFAVALETRYRYSGVCLQNFA